MKHYSIADKELENELNPITKKFERKVNDFMIELLDKHSPSSRPLPSRVINDPIWGSIYFTKHEVMLLDSPIMQRLRNLSQVGLASLTFPSARHSRFEHSIGTFHIVSEVVNNINKRADENMVVSSREFSMIKLAALLHDIGHCLYSHISERVYGNMEEFNTLRRHPLFKRKNAKAHEIFAYFMINSERFKTFFKSLLPDIVNYDSDDFYDSIGRMIVGYPVVEVLSDETKGRRLVQKHFMTSMINGGFDADKLDYIRRDAYFTGLSSDYDIARLLYRMDIVEDRTEEDDGTEVIHKVLVLPLSGVSAIEEIAFSKIQLTSSVYYHQKVLAADALVVDFSNHMISNKIVEHPCDFLNHTERSIWEQKNEIFDRRLSEDISEKTFLDLMQEIDTRTLPKRALEIKMSYIKQTSVEEESNLTVLTDSENGNVLEQMQKMDKMRERIYELSKKILDQISKSNLQPIFKDIKSFDKFDIFTSFKQPPTFSSADINIVGRDKKLIPLDDLMPLREWTEAFAANKWTGYIFSREDIIPIVNVAARIYLKNELDIEIKDNFKHVCLKQTDISQVMLIDEFVKKGNLD
jgi:HD superfamily phosphohydrolase